MLVSSECTPDSELSESVFLFLLFRFSSEIIFASRLSACAGLREGWEREGQGGELEDQIFSIYAADLLRFDTSFYF